MPKVFKIFAVFMITSFEGLLITVTLSLSTFFHNVNLLVVFLSIRKNDPSLLKHRTRYFNKMLFQDSFSHISIHLPSGSEIHTNVPNSLFSGSFKSGIPILLKCSIQASISST